MELQKLEPHELLTVIRDLKTARHAKHSEEKNEEVRLEKLKLRLRIMLSAHTRQPNDTSGAKTA